MHNYKKLNVWKEGMELIKDVYSVTSKFPREELYGITAQIKKSVISIPSNVAEGAGRGTNKDFNRFLDYSFGSTCELDTQIIASHDLTFLATEDFDRIQDRLNYIQRMLNKLKQYQEK